MRFIVIHSVSFRYLHVLVSALQFQAQETEWKETLRGMQACLALKYCLIYDPNR